MKTTSLKTLDIVVYALLIIGALNWGLVGLFSFDLVAFILGPASIPGRIVYVIVGAAAVYDLLFIKVIWKRWGVRFHEPAHT